MDKSFGTRYLRTDALEKIVFTHDSLGNTLPQSVEMLVAGIWDLGVGNPKQRNISIAVRDDNTGNWNILDITSVPSNDNGFASVRSMAIHKDYVTGAQYLIIGAANGGIFKGVYDPNVAGKIRWVGGNEVNSQFGRPQSMTVCKDTLYASFDYGGLTVTGQTGGLFKRVDGVNPSWQQVYTFYNPSFPNYNQTLRGVSTVPSLTQSGEFDIIGAIESIPIPIVIRFQPYNNYQTVNEVNYVTYFTNVFGSAPQYYNNLAAAAMNKLEPFLNPFNGDYGYFITTNLLHPQNPAFGFNGAYFMYRKSNGNYDWGYIQPDSSLLSGQELRGVRTIEKSPFNDEPNVYYFAGFPPGTFFVKNTAWIYKGIIQNPVNGITEPGNNLSELSIFPNPTQNQLTISNLPTGFSGIVSIYNAMGQLIYSEHKTGSQFSIETGQLNTGIYFVQVKTDKGETMTRKFIKQ